MILEALLEAQREPITAAIRAVRSQAAADAPGGPIDPAGLVDLLIAGVGATDGTRQEVISGFLGQRAEQLAPLPAVVSALGDLRHAAISALRPALDADHMIEAVYVIQAVLDDVVAAVGGAAVARAELAADIDGLTGLGNRRALERDLERELAHSARQGRQLSVVLLDLDGLKDINDSAGHAAGDDALRRLAAALERGLRAGDRAYRIGGDEFMLLLPETVPADAATVVGRVFSRHPPPFSWGAAGSPLDGADMTALLEAADRRLFQRRRRARGLPPLAAGPPESHAGREWAKRPVLAATVRAVAIAGPVVLAGVTAVLLGWLLPRGPGVGRALGWWTVVLLSPLVVVVAAGRVAQRLLPLAILLRLNLGFPDRAPSRFGLALRAGSARHLEHRVAALRDGEYDEPARAAAEVLVLVTALSAHDRRTRGHCERVRAYTDMLSEQLGLARDQRDRLRWAGLLHDIGKLSVSPAILNKPAALEEAEWDSIHRHPAEGARVVAPLAPWLGTWGRAVLEHHERWDGLGYPAGLAGEDISLAARVVAVADAFEVMTAPRSYKPSMNADQARAQLAAGAGTQFDPRIVRAFLNLSLGRIRWVIGPLAWLVELPLLGRAGRLPRLVSLHLAGLAAAATIVGGLQVLGPALGSGSGPLPGSSSPATASSGAGPANTGTGPTAGTPHLAVLGEAMVRDTSPTTAALSPPPTTPPVPQPLAPAAVAAAPAGRPSTGAPTTGGQLPPGPVGTTPSITSVAHTSAGHPVRIPVVAGATTAGSVVLAPAHGSAHPAGPGTVLYKPAAGFVGTDHFTYRDCGVTGCVVVSVTVIVA